MKTDCPSTNVMPGMSYMTMASQVPALSAPKQSMAPGCSAALPPDAAIGIEHREERLRLKGVARRHDEHAQSAGRSIP